MASRSGRTKRTDRQKKGLVDKPVIRISIVGCMVLAILISVAVKTLKLQVLNREQALELARRQHHAQLTLLPRRGKIVDANHKELALNVDAYSVYARPQRVSDPGRYASRLSRALGLPASRLKKKLRYKGSFVWIKRLVDPRTAAAVRELGLAGVGVVKESKRVYPNDHLLGQVLGFTDVDSRGIEGLEYQYDKVLAGKPEEIVIRRDGMGREIVGVSAEETADSSGRDITLTIDSQIQYIVEEELKAGVVNAEADGGMAVMMNPETGAVLAMASYPFFDPNSFTSYPARVRRNLPIWYTFEPGSTMKVFLVAAAIEERKVVPSTVFYCFDGARRVANTVINDIKPHGELTVADIIKYSSNIGATLIAEELGKKKYYDYLRKFGFGQKTGIDLPGEAAGIVRDYNLWGPVELATQAFGQGLSVTALQLATALSAVANGGFLMEPYIVEKITGRRASDYKAVKPSARRRVISYETAKTVREMMERVVAPDGTGAEAAVPGYATAGKTGTAQVVDARRGGYKKDSYIASFMGFAPADDPRAVLVVVIINPRKSPYGGVVAAPVFRKIMAKVLFHLGVPPERSFADTIVMPNLRGLSARDTLKWGAEQGVVVKLKGKGYVASQYPPPGKRIKRGMVCQVELKQNL